MSLYSQFATNQGKEVDGVLVQYGPNSDGTVPTFKLSRMGKSNKRYAKALDAATKPYRRQLELGTMDQATSERVFMEVFVTTVLLSWDDVEIQGEKAAFNKANAIKLLTDLPELYDDLQEKAKSAALFRDEALEIEAKN